MKKQVNFNLEKNETFYTHSNNEYDRLSIDHVLYRRAYQRISDEEINAIYVNLDLYKLYEMTVHSNSIHNNSYHVKKT